MRGGPPMRTILAAVATLAALAGCATPDSVRTAEERIGETRYFPGR